MVQCVRLKYSTIWKVDIFNPHIIPLQFTSTFLLNVLSTFYYVRSINCKWLFDEFKLLLLPALCKEFTWQENGSLGEQDAHELYLAIASAIQTSTGAQVSSNFDLYISYIPILFGGASGRGRCGV